MLWIKNGMEKAAAALPTDQYPSLTAPAYKRIHLDISVKKWLPERSVHFNTYGLIPPSFNWIKLNQAMA